MAEAAITALLGNGTACARPRGRFQPATPHRNRADRVAAQRTMTLLLASVAAVALVVAASGS